jgi:hypothetical protein
VFLAFKGGSWRARHPSKGVANLSESSDKPTCQLCSKKGHIADRCYKRFDSTFKPPPRPPLRNRPSPPQALFVQPGSAPPETWYLDSGASNHVASDLNSFTSYTPYTGPDQLRVADGTGLPILHIGSSRLLTNHHPLLLNNVLHVPTVFKSLLSISQLVNDNDVVVHVLSRIESVNKCFYKAYYILDCTL